MSNEGTRKQLKESFEVMYESMINPDPKIKIKEKRKEKSKKIAKKYGF